MIVKVCGMREANNIHALEQVGTELSSVDNQWAMEMIGFIFWKGSKRFVSKMPTYMPTQMKRVGVFVNEDIKQVRRIAEEYKLDYIQLHGSESPAYIQGLKESFLIINYQLSIIKAFSISETSDFTQAMPYEAIADLFLFDTKGKMVGGNGEKVDWKVLNGYKGNTPFLLSGGIGPEDATRIKKMFTSIGEAGKSAESPQSKCVGIDLNSRFETSPGVKDILKIKTFIQSLNRKHHEE